MKNILVCLLVCAWAALSVTRADGQAPTPPTYYIPTAGATYNTLTYSDIANQTIYVTTIGAINLTSNTFTITYGSLPGATTVWNVILDASSLTLDNRNQVNIFGTTPLSKYPHTNVFYINFSVVWYNGAPIKTVNYCSSLVELDSLNNNLVINGNLRVNGTTTLNGPLSLIGTTTASPAPQDSFLVLHGGTVAIDTSCYMSCHTADSIFNTRFSGKDTNGTITSTHYVDSLFNTVIVGGTYTVKVTLTAAQIKNSHSVPDTLIKAPISGQFIQLLSCVMYYAYGNAVYAVSGGVVGIFQAGVAIDNTIINGTIFGVTANTYSYAYPAIGTSVSGTIPFSGAPILFESSSANPTNSGTGGTLTFYLTYVIFAE